MADDLLVFRDEAEFLKQLGRHKVEFMMIGLAAAALQGAPIVTQDIDLWFKDLSDPGIKKSLKIVGGTYVSPIVGNSPTFAGKKVSLFDIVVDVDGLKKFDEEMTHTTVFDLYGAKVPVLHLERIIKSKKKANRPKDRLSLPVLEDALKVLKHRR